MHRYYASRAAAAIFCIVNSALLPAAETAKPANAAPKPAPVAPKIAESLIYTEADWTGVPGINLIANPGFELKANSWGVDYFKASSIENALGVANSKPSHIAPGKGIDGSDALLLSSGPALVSYCAPLKVGETYTLSAYVKATEKPADVWMAGMDPGWKMYSSTTKNIGTGKWTRISKTFKFELPSVQKKFYARFNTSAPVLMDNVQLQVGELTEYQAPALTVGLVAPDGGDSVFVRGKDKLEMTLRAIPGAGLSTARVELTATDTWGQTAWTKTVEVQGAPVRQAIELPGDKLGVFRVKTRATTADGKVVGLGLSTYAIIEPPARESSNEQRYFGLCIETDRYPTWSLNRWIDWCNLLGVRFNRTGLYMVHTDLVPPANYAAAIRPKFDIFKKADIETIACINPMPKSLLDRIGNADMPTSDMLSDYRTAVAAVVAPFKGSIEYWEIMNEVNIWRYNDAARKGQKSMGPEKYVAAMKVAAEAVRSADSGAKVAAPALNTMDYDYVDRMIQLGAMKSIDMFTVHPYRSHADMPPVYDDMMRLRAQLNKGGFKGPLVNGEQYFGANVFELKASDEEAKRGYYVPGREQRRAAGRIVRHYVHHIAAGVPFALFDPERTVLKPDPDQDAYLFDGFGAYNAATRFLVNAGRGRPLTLAGDMRAFVFPNAAGGPLAVMYSVNPESKTMMRLPGTYEAFDMMGNRISAEQAAAGLRMATDPVYIRFASGATADQIASTFRSADVSGAGVPVEAEARIAGLHELALNIRNRQLKPVSGTAVLDSAPAEWSRPTDPVAFSNVVSGQTSTVVFKLDKMPMESLGAYPVSFKLTSGKESFVVKSVTRPFFATPASSIKVDGELKDWSNAKWATLDDGHLSKAIGSDPHTGASDLSARIASSWNSDGVYLAIEVTDDAVSWPKAAASMYNDDSMQMFFDPANNAGAAGRGTEASRDDDAVYSIGLLNGKATAHLDKNPEGRYVGEANRGTGIDVDVQVAIRRVDNKTYYEMYFPQRVLPQARLEAGKSIGFALLINDNDGKGRKTGLTTNPDRTEPHMRPDLFVDLVLLAQTKESR